MHPVVSTRLGAPRRPALNASGKRPVGTSAGRLFFETTDHSLTPRTVSSTMRVSQKYTRSQAHASASTRAASRRAAASVVRGLRGRAGVGFCIPES